MKIKDFFNKLSSQENCDAFLISSDITLSYLFKQQCEGAYFLLIEGKGYIFTDLRYILRWENILEGFEDIDVIVIKDGLYALLKQLLDKKGVKSLGFEGKYVVFNSYCRLNQYLEGITLVPIDEYISSMRVIKQDWEIDRLRNALAITGKGFDFLKEYITVGISEQDIAIELEHFFHLNGGRLAFPLLILSSENASCPHGVPSNRSIGRNQPILIDAGTVFQGYRSDLTRVLCLGKMDTYLEELYILLSQIQKHIYSLIKPGVVIADLANACDEFLEEHDLKQFQAHSLGHGLGLEVHEQPFINKNNTDMLQPGMVFTVEPGIYKKGHWGLRKEDMVLVTDSGCEVLSGDII